MPGWLPHPKYHEHWTPKLFTNCDFFAAAAIQMHNIKYSYMCQISRIVLTVKVKIESFTRLLHRKKTARTSISFSHLNYIWIRRSWKWFRNLCRRRHERNLHRHSMEIKIFRNGLNYAMGSRANDLFAHASMKFSKPIFQFIEITFECFHFLRIVCVICLLLSSSSSTPFSIHERIDTCCEKWFVRNPYEHITKWIQKKWIGIYVFVYERRTSNVERMYEKCIKTHFVGRF